MTVDLLHGNCLDILPTLPDCSVDSIVTDPPYELGFMGKKWDNSGIAYNPELWAECLRVLKPGGHLLAFGGTRTYHRMAVAIEDAGFEIRDSLHWIYGSGFPKSLDVSKAIDKQAGAQREVIGQGKGRTGEAASPNGSSFSDDNYQWPGEFDITAPATEQAKEWSGWGTALKPAHEPIVVARKPLVGTVAGNVLQWGTGAINIDGARVGTNGGTKGAGQGPQGNVYGDGLNGEFGKPVNGLGRWPANIVFTHNHDCADTCTEGCPVRELDRQSGTSRSGKPRDDRGMGGIWTDGNGVPCGPQHGDSGGASRFFTVTEWDAPFRYVAKPGKRERNAGLDALQKRGWKEQGFRDNETTHLSPRAGAGRTSENQNHHPTVKPLALMRWLVRLVTPPNGTVLEPFAGSGTTLVACHMEGFDAIGIEMTDEYLPIIEGRLEWARQQPPDQQSDQQELEL
jgi:site-specific DNA-methyltransferase (adenine-specific)